MLRRLLASFVAFLLFASQTMSFVSAQTLTSGQHAAPLQLAQLSNSESPPNWPADIDIDPPVIDHEALGTGVPGQTQEFSARVIDDRGLAHVLLFYRDSPGIQYQRVEMVQSNQSTEYTSLVATALGQKKIEYYIEALDTGGNRVLKGFPFFPLIRQLESAPVSPAPEVVSTPQSKFVYVLMGAAVVGLALALSGGNDEPTTPQPGTVPLTINVRTP